MRGDVLFHVFIGQALVGRLVALGSLAGSDDYYLIARVIATDFLKHLVFVGAVAGGAGVEGLGNFNGASGDADSQILHSGNLLFFWACCPVVLFCLGCCSLAVITLYDTSRDNLSYYWYFFEICKEENKKTFRDVLNLGTNKRYMKDVCGLIGSCQEDESEMFERCILLICLFCKPKGM